MAARAASGSGAHGSRARSAPAGGETTGDGGRSDQQGGVPHEQRRRCRSRPGVVGVPPGAWRRVQLEPDGGRQHGGDLGRSLQRRRGHDGRAARERGRGVAVVILARVVVAARRGGHRRRGRHQRTEDHGGQQGRADPEHERTPPPAQHGPMVAQSGRYCTHRCHGRQSRSAMAGLSPRAHRRASRPRGATRGPSSAHTFGAAADSAECRPCGVRVSRA